MWGRSVGDQREGDLREGRVAWVGEKGHLWGTGDRGGDQGSDLVVGGERGALGPAIACSLFQTYARSSVWGPGPAAAPV